LAVAEQVRTGDEIASLVARDSDVFCPLRIWSTTNADKEPAGRKGALFAGQAILQSDGSQEFIAVNRGHNGIGEHFHVSRRQDAVDKVRRKSAFEGIAAADHGDFSRYPGKRQGGLTGGVAAAHDEHVLVPAKAGLAGAGSVIQTFAMKSVFRWAGQVDSIRCR
jgi:hypothetical protein